MKTYILSAFILLGSYANAQYPENLKKQVLETPTTYQDSLILATKMINELDFSNLIKQKERFTYLSREKSNKIYPVLLTIITDRIKNYNNEK